MLPLIQKALQEKTLTLAEEFGEYYMLLFNLSLIRMQAAKEEILLQKALEEVEATASLVPVEVSYVPASSPMSSTDDLNGQYSDPLAHSRADDGIDNKDEPQDSPKFPSKTKKSKSSRKGDYSYHHFLTFSGTKPGGEKEKLPNSGKSEKAATGKSDPRLI